jgi:hypothetical protein
MGETAKNNWVANGRMDPILGAAALDVDDAVRIAPLLLDVSN